MKRIGIRRETKSVWEKRVPLIPEDVRELKEKYGIETVIQPSDIRIFPDEAFREAGAVVSEKLDAPFIFGVKEMPLDFFEEGKTYIFFSHTIKAQEYNMPMLKRMIELKTTLIDYERIVDDNGRRLIAFGKFAGIAGMIDSLWALGKRFELEGIKTPLSHVKRAYEYRSVKELEEQSQHIGEEIQRFGFPEEISPMVVGIAGYGNVSQGAQEVLHFFPVQEVAPSELKDLKGERHHIYKVVFKEEDMVVKKDGGVFELQDYYNHPEKYQGIFENYLPYLTLLVNAIYWDERYPRLVTKDYLKKNYVPGESKLKVIGDISCDINGAIECNEMATEPGEPVYVYEPKQDRIVMGINGEGPVILAVDILPSEVPMDASIYFSHILKKFVPEIVNGKYPEDFERCTLPPYLKRAVIVYRGELTPDYRYLKEHL